MPPETVKPGAKVRANPPRSSVLLRRAGYALEVSKQPFHEVYLLRILREGVGVNEVVQDAHEDSWGRGRLRQVMLQLRAQMDRNSSTSAPFKMRPRLKQSK